MPSRINIAYKIADTRSETKKRQFKQIGLQGNIEDVNIVTSYVIDHSLSKVALQKIAEALSNPLLEESFINKIPFKKENNGYAIEIGFLPGVTDNVGTTAKETIEDILKKKMKSGESVYSSQIYLVSGSINEEDAKKIANSLHNPLIQSARIETYKEFKKSGVHIKVPKVRLKTSQSNAVSTVDLNVSDEVLAEIGKKGIEDTDGSRRGPLALDLEYMKAIQVYFKKLRRNPTDIELESIAQTWSEHCKHTIFADKLDDIEKGLYRTFIKEATNKIRAKKKEKDFCVSVFTDNAGGIILDKEYLITHKVETHNSPSALDPFGGSITGIVGVNRDAIGFGMGAKPVANTYGFCLAYPEDTRPLYRDKQKTQMMLPPRRIMDGVIHGVHVGGNCSGIPTSLGFIFFDERFRGKPLVFVGTLGLIPRKIKGKPAHEKRAQAGDLIVVVGGRVGQDGIHGATFSSEGMDAGSPATAVQIGDPITQKKLSDAIVKEARDKGLYRSITDNGAGGISCSVAEMAKECNGAYVELDKVPLKYPGLEPWKTWISESQERMTLAVPKNKWKEFKKLMDKRGVEATTIGKFTKNGKCIVTYKDKTIMDMDLEFLHNGLPKKDLISREMRIVNKEPVKSNLKDFTKVVEKFLSRKNICSFEFISRQYDHEVQASSVIKPLQGKGQVNGEASVLRPLLTSDKGVVISNGLTPTFSEIDPYNMAASSIDTALRAAVAAGADIDYLAILDNFCWCSSTEPERLYQLKLAVKACYDYAIAYETPFISGKDSMFNDFKGFDEKGNPIKISIPPTLLVSAIGVIPDVTKSISIDPKSEGDLIYLLGDTHDELGGSEYYISKGEPGNAVPSVNAEKNRILYKNFYRASQKDLIASAISVSRGGLAAALPKMAIAGKLGIEVDLSKISGNASSDENKLFSESQGRILVTIAPQNKKSFETLFKDANKLGKVSVEKKASIIIKGKTGRIVSLPVKNAYIAYKSPFKNF